MTQANETSPPKPQDSGVAGKVALVFAAAAAVLSLAAFARSGGPNEAEILRIANAAPERVALQAEQARLARVALYLAVNQLNTVVSSGAPFVTEHALATSLSGGRKEVAGDLATLAPLSKDGVPTIRALVHEFEQRAADALVSERTPADAGWFGQTYGRLSAVTVALLMEARVNPLGSASAPVIRDMQQSLSRGDVAAALALAETLPAEARATFAPWMDLARKRLDAVASAKRLVAHAVAASQDK